MMIVRGKWRLVVEKRKWVGELACLLNRHGFSMQAGWFTFQLYRIQYVP